MSKKILVVDDSLSIRRMVETTLKSKGCDVTTAEGEQAARARRARLTEQPRRLRIFSEACWTLTGN